MSAKVFAEDRKELAAIIVGNHELFAEKVLQLDQKVNRVAANVEKIGDLLESKIVEDRLDAELRARRWGLMMKASNLLAGCFGAATPFLIELFT